MKRTSRKVKAVEGWARVDETGHISRVFQTMEIGDRTPWSDNFHTYHYIRVRITPIPTAEAQ